MISNLPLMFVGGGGYLFSAKKAIIWAISPWANCTLEQPANGEMTNDFKLPLVGLGTCYCEFSKEDPDAGVRRHRGGLRRGKAHLGDYVW